MGDKPKAPTEPWKPGTEVVALYNFKGNSTEDLPFSKRDVLEIVKSTRDPMWYLAKKPNGSEGMIPANYVQKRGEVKLHAMPWFHGRLQRGEAEQLLQSHEDGLFLVRESNNFPGDYTLCVCANGKVEHYHIVIHNNKLTIDEDVHFENLIQLVEHYEKDADGLCTELKQPLKKKGNFEFAVDKQAFVDQGWVIKFKDLKLGEAIGKGEFAGVLKATYNGQTVAVKALKDGSKDAQEFLAEASVMTALKHKNLVELLGVVLGETIYIVTEYMARGSLVDYLRSRGRAVITASDQICFASDTCNGMAFLEKKKLVHRDLAARNVLIADDNTAKVSDFGLARYVDSNHEGGKFPIKWTSPEALRESKFTKKSDMWSFGVLLWEIYSFGRVPYPRIPLSDVVAHVERGYRMEAPDGCPKEIYDIMIEAWNLDHNKRPDFATVSVKLENLRALTPVTTPVQSNV
ncbi:Tyrosine-protein kinase CSK [Lamellibrachia satsuma]|nr:Tyrosine-protein kinase CSK [Lamellibrachia satsuma]